MHSSKHYEINQLTDESIWENICWTKLNTNKITVKTMIQINDSLSVKEKENVQYKPLFSINCKESHSISHGYNEGELVWLLIDMVITLTSTVRRRRDRTQSRSFPTWLLTTCENHGRHEHKETLTELFKHTRCIHVICFPRTKRDYGFSSKTRRNNLN